MQNSYLGRNIRRLMPSLAIVVFLVSPAFLEIANSPLVIPLVAQRALVALALVCCAFAVETTDTVSAKILRHVVRVLLAAYILLVLFP